jgi:hypothetical protein
MLRSDREGDVLDDGSRDAVDPKRKEFLQVTDHIDTAVIGGDADLEPVALEPAVPGRPGCPFLVEFQPREGSEEQWCVRSLSSSVRRLVSVFSEPSLL